MSDSEEEIKKAAFAKISAAIDAHNAKVAQNKSEMDRLNADRQRQQRESAHAIEEVALKVLREFKEVLKLKGVNATADRVTGVPDPAVEFRWGPKVSNGQTLTPANSFVITADGRNPSFVATTQLGGRPKSVINTTGPLTVQWITTVLSSAIEESFNR